MRARLHALGPAIVAAALGGSCSGGPRESPGTSAGFPAWTSFGAARLTGASSSIAVTLRLEGATGAAGELSGDTLFVRNGWRGQGDLTRRAVAGGFEDFIALERRPQEEGLRYELRLETPDVGLRTVGGALEILDPTGAPRLRMAPPYVIDQGGHRRSPRVSLEGCAASSDPSAPWGRPITPPGSNACVVRVDWSGLDVAYPALVDPLWSAAGSMAELRYAHTATLLPDGKVLAVGGLGLGANYSAELYDPATETWAMTDGLPGDQGVVSHTATLLLDGRVLVAGGVGDVGPSLGTSFLYDEASGTWSAGGTLNQARTFHAAALLDDGRVLVFGGEGAPDDYLASAELFDPATDLWTPAADGPFEILRPKAATLPGGRVLVVGGLTEQLDPTSQTAIFDPGGTWILGPPIKQPRYAHELTVLPNGDVLMTGGFIGGPDPTPAVQRFVAASSTWSDAAPLGIARADHVATTLPGGRVLVAGGLDNLAFGAAIGTAEIYDAVLDAWTGIDPMSTPRSSAAAVLLSDGSVLVSGGGSPDTLSSSERLVLLPDGQHCDAGVVCASGACADGVCCDSVCDAPCSACSAALKGEGTDGTCGSAAAHTDPRGDCLDSGAAACDLDGRCDGAGACEKYPAAPGCSPAACASGEECASGHCVDGICCDAECDGPCRSCSKAGGSLEDGVCQAAQPGSDDAKGCAPYGCNLDGTCKSSCGSVDECAPPTVCSAEGRCEHANTEGGGESDGCGCRLRGAEATDARGVAALLALALALARRRARGARKTARGGASG